MLNYAKLRNIEEKEKGSAMLTEVGADFYRIANQYINELEDRIEEEKIRNPSSKKILLIADELRNAKRLLESIFERREKKIVLAALSSARGGKSMPENLTREEKIFYEAMLGLFKENRKRIFESNKKEFLIVRVIKDIPQFMGSDMKKYSLKKEDVISLPYEVAQLLIKRGAAEEINPDF
ncbi:MAG: hypothetical protein FE047_02430 [Thermoplasmata archaeon]|nr:MAG: hypothetical protein FE047_02430 [Thermoplasmata archaeon]KAA0011634.1 MAG: hypothetical protein FE041_04040 [Thermoplasmata archaeon]